VSDPQLGPDEDAELRRLHMLKGFGMVAGSISSRYDTLRDRDRRKGVRDPEETSMATPLEKKTWDTPSKSSASAASSVVSAAAMTAQRNGSDAQRVVGDTREIFGERPEPRRGLGLFRR
jgi:hypothetical protein